MRKFEKPKIIPSNEVNEANYLRVAIEPLEKGFGTTLGNALRRVMLSSLPGSAITSVKIEGVMHEFQKIDGVVEDVTTIVLNLKNIVVKNNTDEEKIDIIPYDVVNSIKITFPRNCISGSICDNDIYVYCTCKAHSRIDYMKFHFYEEG